MSVPDQQILELIAIHREQHRSFLQIKLTLDHEIEFLWDIDNMTADYLQAIANFNANDTYKLSFYNNCDTSKTKFISRITRTSANQSDSMDFSCSKEYTRALQALQQIQNLEQLQTLPFIFIQTMAKEQIKENSTYLPFPVLISKFAWMSALILCFITIGYTNYTNASFNPVKAEEPSKQVILASTPKTATETIEAEKPAAPAIPVVKLASPINYSLPKGKVAITLDDGPSKYSKKLVDVLKKYNVGGTFFYIGQRVKQYPEYVKYTNKNGFSIGNHSLSHSKFTELPIKQQEQEITVTNQLIKNITNEPVILFRPPYGARNNSTIKLTKKYHLELVLWSIDTRDWESHDAKKIIQAVKKEKASGSIILLHESQATLEALPDIIEYLQKQGLEIVNLQ